MAKKLSIAFLLIVYSAAYSFAQLRKPDSSKAVTFATIPLINYNRTIGFAGGAMVSVFYKMNKKDTISPTSSTGMVGMYSTNKTYFLVMFQQMYLKQDKWRIKAGIGTGNINFQYYQQIASLGTGGFIDFNTNMNFAYGEVKRRVYKKIYVGGFGCLSTATTTYDITNPLTGEKIKDKRSMNNIGYILSYDTRDNQMNPYKGFNFNWKHSFFEEWLGSGNNFGKLDLSFTKFLKLNTEKNIVVMRATSTISYGDVPFQGQNVVSGDDIRGYTNGKYRNNQLYSTQAEYRWNFYKKWGAVGFIGIATVTDKLSDLKGIPFLPGAGVGIRYKMIPSERINVGIDVAAGKNDWGIYFRIGDTFGR
jgi:outer membrane protein assembly factor BamA